MGKSEARLKKKDMRDHATKVIEGGRAGKKNSVIKINICFEQSVASFALKYKFN